MSDRERRRAGQQRRERPLLLPCFYFVEVPLFGIATVLAYILHFTSVFKTPPVSYDPSDVKIALPYTTQKNRTLSIVTMYVSATVIPGSLIALVESSLLVFAVCYKGRTETTIGSTGCYIGASVRRAIRFIGVYLFGLLVTSALCDVLRKRIAALAPHFLSVCKPKHVTTLISESVANSIGENNPDPLKLEKYYFSDDCSTMLGVQELQEARLNLPSYFTSLSTYAAVYLLLYLRLITSRAGPVVTSLVLCSILLYPFVVGMLEVAENTSHVISAISGWILGTSMAYLLSHEIFSNDFVPGCKCPKIFRRKISRRKPDNEANNVFEDPATPKFSMRGYDVAEDDGVISVSSSGDSHEEDGDVTQIKSEAGSHRPVTGISPALSKQSHPVSEHTEDRHRKSHTAERKVIKELQTYMTETEVRGGLDSPRPTQIRELSRGSAQNRKQVFSTFQTTPEIEVHERQIGDVDSAPTTIQGLHVTSNINDSPASFRAGLSPNLKKVSLMEARPFSYHGRRSSQTSDSSFEEANPHPQEMDGRPLSYSFHPRSQRSSLSKETVPAIHEPPGTAPVMTYFANDAEPDLLRGTPIDTSPLVIETNQTTCSNAEEKDVVNETSNLLREELEVMEDEDRKKLTPDSQSSDETITEDQPSIVV